VEAILVAPDLRGLPDGKELPDHATPVFYEILKDQ
jgi:hypothetical protein